MSENLYTKLFDLQKNPPELLKDAQNPHFKNTYITLGAVLNAVLPELHSRNIVLTQALSGYGPSPSLKTRLTDTESDEFIEDNVPLVLDKESPQAVGSAITYYRRYSLLTLLGFNADDDDDGEKATSNSKDTSGRSGQKKLSASF